MFMIVGMLSGIAGTLQTARLGSAMSTAGQGKELSVISAVVIGGAALSGGEGTVLGTFLGVILLAFVVNALVLLNVSIYWQSVVSGIVLLVAVAIDILAKKRAVSDAGTKKA
jgi:ribose transport system permease protein